MRVDTWLEYGEALWAGLFVVVHSGKTCTSSTLARTPQVRNFDYPRCLLWLTGVDLELVETRNLLTDWTCKICLLVVHVGAHFTVQRGEAVPGLDFDQPAGV